MNCCSKIEIKYNNNIRTYLLSTLLYKYTNMYVLYTEIILYIYYWGSDFKA